MNFIDQFDRVRIINIASRKDRRDETVSEFNYHELDINSSKVEFFDAISPNENGGFPNPGARGCFLSHLEVIEEASKAGAKNLLVLEDDIQFSKKLSQYGNFLFEKLNNLDWDIAYFGHAIKNDKDEVEWKIVNQPMLLSHFYAINGKSLDRLIVCLNEILQRPPGHPDGGPMHYDGALNTFMQQNVDIKAYYCSFNLGYQRPSKTDVHELSPYEANLFIKPLINAIRYFKKIMLPRIR